MSPVTFQRLPLIDLLNTFATHLCGERDARGWQASCLSVVCIVLAECNNATCNANNHKNIITVR